MEGTLRRTMQRIGEDLLRAITDSLEQSKREQWQREAFRRFINGVQFGAPASTAKLKGSVRAGR